MYEKIVNYEEKLITTIEIYNERLNKVLSIFELIVITVGSVINKIVSITADILELIQRTMRYTTFPIHWIWIRLHLRKESSSKITDLRLFKKGAHYIYGLPEAGKSTLIYHVMMDYAYYSGRTSYTTERMELPRKDIFGKHYYLHQQFQPSEFFQDGKQVVALDTNKHNVVVYEEMLSKYHQRNNNSNEHNNEVLPLVASMGGQRHQGKGIDLFYFISQLPTNDISIMQMLAGYHEPRIKKGFDYKHWLETGKFRFGIKGWWITSYNIQVTGRTDYTKVNKYKWFYKFKYEEDFKYFNRFNLKDHYNKLPLHKGSEMNI